MTPESGLKAPLRRGFRFLAHRRASSFSADFTAALKPFTDALDIEQQPLANPHDGGVQPVLVAAQEVEAPTGSEMGVSLASCLTVRRFRAFMVCVGSNA